MDIHAPSYGLVPDDTTYELGERFRILRTLGEGMYGKVKLAVEVNTNKKVRYNLLNSYTLYCSRFYMYKVN